MKKEVANFAVNLTFDGGNFTSKNSTKFSMDALIDKTLLKVEIVTLTLALIFAFFGNLIVVITLLYRRYVKKTASNKKNKFTRMNFFIIHLSLADIYVSLGNILTMLLWRMNNNIFYGGDLACRLVAYVQLVSVYYSTYVLIMMTFDRFEAICRPLVGLGWSKQRGHIYILVAFICAHLQGIPQVLLFKLREIPNVDPPQSTCYAMFNPRWLQNVYIVYTFIMQFLLPLCIIIGCYVTISLKVFKGFKASKSKKQQHVTISTDDHEKFAKLLPDEAESSVALAKNSVTTAMSAKSVSSLAKPAANRTMRSNSQISTTTEQNKGMSFRQHATRNFSKSKIKTIKLTLSVIILYIICSTPYFTGLILNTVLDPRHFQSKLLRYLIVLSCLLFQLNSCVNPWIYLSFNINCGFLRGKNKQPVKNTSRMELSSMSAFNNRATQYS